MVKRNPLLDGTFGSLAHPVRRDILERVQRRELSVGDIARPYNMSLAAVSKHLAVLEDAKLIEKHRDGKLFLVHLSADALRPAAEYLERYKEMWEDRLDALEAYLKTLQ